jgi:glucose/arabinose dehydrogenase
MGPVNRNGGEQPELNSLGPAAVYDDPKFSWAVPVAPTDLEFFPSARLGSQYKNDLFVGTTRGGKIMRFDLTGTRKSLALAGDLADGVADNSTGDRFAEQAGVIFGNDFGLVSDLQSGPGGLYVTDFSGGTIYRITTNTQVQSIADIGRASVPEPALGSIVVAIAIITRRKR